MNVQEFIKRLETEPLENRAAFSAHVMNMSKLSAAEAVVQMLEFDDFAIKINAIKAIRKFELDNFEKMLIKLLIDDEDEVRVAAIKTLCSFGKSDHFKLARAFFNESANLRTLIIDSFVSFSDTYDAHEFMFYLLDSTNEKIKNSTLDWFDKALDREVFKPWIVDIYKNAPFSLQIIFEDLFAYKLDKLFDSEFGYRFKLAYIARRLDASR